MPDIAPVAAETVVAPVVTEAAPVAELSGDALMEQALKELAAPDAESVAVEPAKADPAPAVVETPPSEEELSKSWTAYRAKQKRLVAERAAFAEEQRKSTERQATLDKRQAELDSIETEGKTNPVKALERLGYTKDQVLEFLASDGKIPPEVMLKNAAAEQQKKLDDIQKKLDEQTAEAEERKKASIEAQRQQERVSVERGVAESMVDVLVQEKAKYPTLLRVAQKAGPEALKMVLNEVAEHFKKTKNVLAISDAMVQVEQALKAHAAIFVDAQAAAAVADTRQAGAVEPANPGNIEPISSKTANARGVLAKKPVEELTDDEAMELATAQLKGAAE